MKTSRTLRIDHRTIPYEQGQTIMDAAMAAGIYIPHLCHNPEFKPHGSCRVCTVEVNGHYTAACTFPAETGQQVRSDTEEITTLRRSLVQMLFVEGNHICPACEKSGACQLQAVAYYIGMLEPHFTHFFPQRPIDASHSQVAIDFNRCILCELCVRASRDIDGKNVFAISGRGLKSRLVVNSSSGDLGDSDFAVTDKAAQVCPVGAILPKHQGYAVPLGKRLYDRKSIDKVADAAISAQERNDNG